MIGDFIQKQRKEHHLTQEEVSAALKISRPTYTLIEQGERDLTISEARTLASIFNLTFEDFLSSVSPQAEVYSPPQKPDAKSDVQIRVTEKNLAKFEQVLLYVLCQVGAKPNVGETVLHKLLYFIDFDYYEKYEENLMGLTYIKNHHGPTSNDLKPVVEAMQSDDKLVSVRAKYHKFDQKKYLPLKQPDIALLTAREISHIDDVLARLSNKNAKEIENYSHGDIPWRAAQEGETISYESVFYRDEIYSVRNYDDEL